MSVNIEEFDHNSAQVNFLVSLLLHFWQIGTAVYDPNQDQVKMTFFSKTSVDNEFTKLKSNISSHLKAHRTLITKNSHNQIEIELVEECGLTKIIVARGLDLFFGKEITIVVELVTEFLGSNLLVDSNWAMSMDWVDLTDIDELLINAQQEENYRKLTGIRSDDRVAIFAGK